MEENKEELIKWLLNGFVQNCGVSLGMRTFFWDFTWYVLDTIQDNQLSLNDYFMLKMPVEYEDTKGYDISSLEQAQIQRIGNEMLKGNEIPDKLKIAFEENFKNYVLNLDE